MLAKLQKKIVNGLEQAKIELNSPGNPDTVSSDKTLND